MRAHLCAVSYARGEDHAIAWSEIDHSPISRGIDLVGQHKADGAAHTVEHFLITMAMHSITFAWTVRPAVRLQSIALHAARINPVPVVFLSLASGELASLFTPCQPNPERFLNNSLQLFKR